MLYILVSVENYGNFFIHLLSMREQQEIIVQHPGLIHEELAWTLRNNGLCSRYRINVHERALFNFIHR